jgi:cytochrome c553
MFPTNKMHIPKIARLLLLSVLVVAARGADEFPAWAYPVAAPAAPNTPVPSDDGSLRHVPGSDVALPNGGLAAHLAAVPDWHPTEHPTMPRVVSAGREPAVWACAYCHLPNGAGRPENASLAGLSPAYFKQQLADFKNGHRAGSEPRRAPQNFMIALAKAATDEEIEQAAAYFASIRPESFVRVVESETVSRTYVAGAMLGKIPGGGMEPLGNRIIEFPEDLGRAENRDSRTPYFAYVPVGSLEKGAALAAASVPGKTLQCAVCHGAGLRGLGDVPRLAGRSPSYLMRQLYDFKAGTRTGATGLMKPVVANLSQDDMIAVAAYVSSMAP